VVARSGEKALKQIEKREVDLILLDIMMPEMDGYEVCKILKSNSETQDIPILFITAKTDDASIVKGFEIGGVDYITKPFRPIELLARVKTHLKLSQTLKSLDFMASRDPMTGIYNRRRFFDLAQTLLETKENLFAVMMDIDKFKRINDTYGHPFGDVIIKSIVKTIENDLPEDAVFGRIGGEEFAILIEATSLQEIQSLIEKIRQDVEDSQEFYEGKSVPFTISNGVSQKVPNDTLDSILKRADEALYEAKETGRNKVCFRGN
jgi:diguanylate cyclase (GGDEF)-like protein